MRDAGKGEQQWFPRQRKRKPSSKITFHRASSVPRSENQSCLLNNLLHSCPNNFSCACVTAHEPETHDRSSCQANWSDDNGASRTYFHTSHTPPHPTLTHPATNCLVSVFSRKWTLSLQFARKLPDSSCGSPKPPARPTVLLEAVSGEAGSIRNSNQVERRCTVAMRASGMIDDAYTKPLAWKAASG